MTACYRIENLSAAMPAVDADADRGRCRRRRGVEHMDGSACAPGVKVVEQWDLFFAQRHHHLAALLE
jgi:hypothetical protein